MSYDFKLMFLYHVSMMLLLVTGRALPLPAEVMIAAALLVVGTLLGIKHRRTTPWVWPGVSASRLVGAVATVVLGALFLSAATPLFQPTNPKILPWYLAGLGITIFATLNTLRLVSLSEADYFAPAPPRQAVELPWKKALRLVYSIFFLAVWLDGVASFYYFGITFRDGSVAPNAVQTEPLSNHGKVVYITSGQKRLIDTLQTGMAIGIPSAFVLGALLHFVVGVRLIPNAPTLEEWRQRREHGRG